MKKGNIRKPKALLSLLLAALLLLCSCGKTQDVSVTSSPDKITAQTEISDLTNSDNENETYAAASEQSNESAGAESGSPNGASDKSSSGSASADSQQFSGASSDGGQASNGEPQNEQPAEAPAEKTDSPQQLEPEEITVTFAVDCKNALGQEYLNNPAFDNVVAAGGVILPETAITVESGTSVMKALKAVLKENKIACSISSSGYVRSINGLAEFDCGSTSGWMYLVNGVLPNVSTKSYILQDGDKVQFRYTCAYGDV